MMKEKYGLEGTLVLEICQSENSKYIVTCYLRSQPIRGSMIGNGYDKTMYAALSR
jgi:hypothetical protein